MINTSASRTSKLQKFILNCGYKDCWIMRRHFKEYYGIKGISGWGSGLGDAKRVTMFKCKKNLFEKGLVENRDNFIILTEKGVGVLKVNGSLAVMQNVNYKEYIKRANNALREFRTWLGGFKKYNKTLIIG